MGNSSISWRSFLRELISRQSIMKKYSKKKKESQLLFLFFSFTLAIFRARITKHVLVDFPLEIKGRCFKDMESNILTLFE
jgi:hypothetical protein